MDKKYIIKKLIYTFILLILVNVFYEGMRFYVQGTFNSREIISKSILEGATLLIAGIVLLKK